METAIALLGVAVLIIAGTLFAKSVQREMKGAARARRQCRLQDEEIVASKPKDTASPTMNPSRSTGQIDRRLSTS